MNCTERKDSAALRRALYAYRFMKRTRASSSYWLIGAEASEEEATTLVMDQEHRIPGRYGIDEIEASSLEVWPNAHPDRDYVVHLEIPEFTCLCPRSGFPDFATITIDYVPDQHIVELKSLKLYINKYRNRQISHESAANTILNDLVTLLSPRWMRVVADFTVRGNIKTIIFAEHTLPAYQGPRPEYKRYLST